MLTYAPSDATLRHRSNGVLDPWHWSWARATPPPVDSRAMSPADAVRAVFDSGRARLVPVAVIGPREPEPGALATAAALGGLRIPLLCGGKGGVMAAAARGARAAGGLTIGFIPDEDRHAANDDIALPLATGIGPARNVLIARSALALIAVGGQYGTITVAAYGLHFDKPVFGLCRAPEVSGVRQMASVAETVGALLPIVLRWPAAAGVAG